MSPGSQKLQRITIVTCCWDSVMQKKSIKKARYFALGQLYWTARGHLVGKNIQEREEEEDERINGRQKLARGDLSCTEVSSPLVCARIIGWDFTRSALVYLWPWTPRRQVVPPPEADKLYRHIFFNFAWAKKKKKLIQKATSSSTSSFPITSYLISDIMGKPDLCEHDSLKIHGKEEHSTWEGTPRAPRHLLLTFDFFWLC